MVKVKTIFFNGFRNLFAIALLLTTNVSNAYVPYFTAGTPLIVNGATSMDINVSLDQNGKVYYAVYKTSPADPTAESIKADAMGATNSNLVKNGIITIEQKNIYTYAYLKGMQENTTYYTYIVAENNAGEIQKTHDITKLTNKFPARQGVYTAELALVPGWKYSYLAYFPEEYYRDTTHNFPSLTILHGNGEKTGEPSYKLRKYGPSKFIYEGHDYPFVVITPQCGFPDWETNVENHNGIEKLVPVNGRFVDEIISTMQRKYHIDPSRNYITGLSMGGGGTFDYIQNFPEKVAAAIPIAGWGDSHSACKTKDVPLWVFQGEYDNAGSMSNLVDAVNSCKPTELAKITVYKGGGHDAWTQTYDNTGYGIAPDNIYDWFLRHVKGNDFAEDKNKSPHVYAGYNQTLRFPPGKLVINGKATDSDGYIKNFVWEQLSGPLTNFEGDNSETLTLNNLGPGRYTFRLTAKDDGGRSAYDEVYLNITGGNAGGEITATNNITEELTISVSPNPFTERLHINLPANLNGETDLQVFDINGKSVYSEKAMLKTPSYDFYLNSNLPKGVYFLKVISLSSKPQVLKIMKE